MRGSVAITVLASCAFACSWDGGLGDARFADDVDEAPPWWDAAWATRHRVTITAAGDAADEGLLVVVPADRAALGLPDWDDVNLAWYDGDTWQRRPFLAVRQGALGDALWLALPRALPSGGRESSLWLYADHPSPPAPIGLDAAYELVEYFDGPTLNGTRWTGTGDVTFTGGQLHVGPGARVEGAMTWGPTFAVDVVVQNTAWSNGMSVGFTGATWSYASDQLRPTLDAWTGSPYPAATSRFELAVDRSASSVRFLADSALHERRDLVGADTTPRRVVLENTAGAGGPDLVIPSLRIRASVEDPPTGTIGPRVARF